MMRLSLLLTLLGLAALAALAIPTSEAAEDCPKQSQALDGLVTVSVIRAIPADICFAQRYIDEGTSFIDRLETFDSAASTALAAFRDKAADNATLDRAWTTYVDAVRTKNPGATASVLEAFAKDLNAFRGDDRLFPTWTAIEWLDDEIDRVDASIDVEYRRAAARTYDATEAKIQDRQLDLYLAFLWPGILAAVVAPVVPVVWGAQWKKKMAYWTAYSQGTRFLDPAQLSAWIAAGALLVGLIVAFIMGLYPLLKTLAS